MTKLDLEKAKLKKSYERLREKKREFNRNIEHWYSMLVIKIAGILLVGFTVGRILK